MTEKEKKIFNDNLLLTQIYCAKQLENCDKNSASIFRSINPIINGKKIFEFKITDYGLEPDSRYSFATEWSQDPYRDESSKLYEELFDLQLLEKKEKNRLIDNIEHFNGKILVASIDESVTDGASEVSSDGLIDIYDCPPIDTWFYLTHETSKRLLYAWIPKEFAYQANDAILVNCVDCIQWFERQQQDDTESSETLNATTKNSFAERIKNIFR